MQADEDIVVVLYLELFEEVLIQFLKASLLHLSSLTNTWQKWKIFSLGH